MGDPSALKAATIATPSESKARIILNPGFGRSSRLIGMNGVTLGYGQTASFRGTERLRQPSFFRATTSADEHTRAPSSGFGRDFKGWFSPSVSSTRFLSDYVFYFDQRMRKLALIDPRKG